jgi:hypothetical protein
MKGKPYGPLSLKKQEFFWRVGGCEKNVTKRTDLQ